MSGLTRIAASSYCIVGQRKGEVLVALRHSVDFVDAHVVEDDDDLLDWKEKKESTMDFSTTEDF
jgi:hypothetical protein